jgi:hypothetical protein
MVLLQFCLYSRIKWFHAGSLSFYMKPQLPHAKIFPGKHFKRIVIKELKNIMQRATCQIHAKASTFRRKWIFAQSVDK